MPLPSMTSHDVSIAIVLMSSHGIDPNSDNAETELTNAVYAYLVTHDHVLPAAAKIRARLAAAIAIAQMGIQPGDPETKGGFEDYVAQGSLASDIPGVGPVLGAGVHTVTTVGKDVVGAAEGAVKATISIGEFLGKLADPTTWLRGVYIVGGSILVLGGVFIVARELGAPNVPKPTSIVTKPARFVFKKKGG